MRGAEIGTFPQQKKETLLADLAIHMMMDPTETRIMVKPLIDSGVNIRPPPFSSLFF